MTQIGKHYGCKKCTKELLITREGKNPGPPMCCGNTMFEILSRF